MKSQLCAVVAEGKNGRIYISPDEEQILTAQVQKPQEYPEAALPHNTRDFKTPNYGMVYFSDLFTNRQLTALTTFSALVGEAQKKAETDAVAYGLSDDCIPLCQGGTGARAYGEAVGVYLAFLIDQLTNQSSSICGWNSVNTQMRCVFSRQAIPMVWDFAECNVFSNSSGSYSNLLERMVKGFESLGARPIGHVRQFDAQSDCGLRNIMVSTDPPYYDNIGYADLSDFFYVWMRQSLKNTYPDLFRTMLVPKAEELVATPYRFGGSVEKAKHFFEDGMLHACQQMYLYAREDVPVTIYYAYKQSDTDAEESDAKPLPQAGKPCCLRSFKLDLLLRELGQYILKNLAVVLKLELTPWRPLLCWSAASGRRMRPKPPGAV